MTDKDSSASIRARLKNIALKERSDFNMILTRYGLERLLYRIGESKYANQFLLKGALLLALWHDMPYRPTRDIDLLGFGKNDHEHLKNVFQDICLITAEDGIVFDPQTVNVHILKKEQGYSGARVELYGELSKARIKIQIDIGYGDIVTPGPIASSYPVLISNLPAPKIRTYPIYTVIAEKFHAIVLLGIANSRLKDYLDLYMLLNTENLDKNLLSKAIVATFTRRNTQIPITTPIGLTDEFTNDSAKQTMWAAFLAKNEINPISLSVLASVIWSHVRPTILEARDLA